MAKLNDRVHRGAALPSGVTLGETGMQPEPPNTFDVDPKREMTFAEGVESFAEPGRTLKPVPPWQGRKRAGRTW